MVTIDWYGLWVVVSSALGGLAVGYLLVGALHLIGKGRSR